MPALSSLEALDDVLRRLEQGELSAVEAIHLLLAEEFETRESRRIKMGLITARLTRLKTLQDYDFAFQPSLERERILTLAQLDFIERKEVVHLLGPPGTGKTHLATALGIEAVKAGKSVYFGTLAEIIASLEKAEREGQLAGRIRFLARNALLIVDETGYLPLSQGGANLFFQLVNARYERGAMILTSNRSFKGAKHGATRGARSSATTWSPPPYSTACALTPASCPRPSSHRRAQTSRPSGGAADPERRPPDPNPADHRYPNRWGKLLRPKWGNLLRR